MCIFVTTLICEILHVYIFPHAVTPAVSRCSSRILEVIYLLPATWQLASIEFPGQNEYTL